jgi:hypothetical protein
MNPIEDLKWNVNYARIEQLERLNRHVEKGGTIGTFLHNVAEWQLDALIRVVDNMPEPEPEKKPHWLLFWKK